jgi:hypothetical protein
LSSVANPQHEIRALFEETVGVENTNTFYDAWLTNHMRKVDVDSLAAWGFNSIRLPMHYNLYTLSIQEEPIPGENTWLEKGFAMTDTLLEWCAENEIYLILDLHAAPGGQGHDAAISDYDDSLPSLWEDENNRLKTIALWQRLAERYSDHPWIGGYDLINEPNWGFDDPNDLHGVGEQNNIPLRELLIDITNAIREVDTNHIIFIEGNSWANNYNGIFPPWDNNMVASFHKYWTVNDKESIQWMLAFRDEYNIPLWLGESGENSNTWYKDAISVVESNNIGWAWWPLKKVGMSSILEIKNTPGYQNLLNYWNNGGPAPSQDSAFAVLMELAENTKLENCYYHPDIVDAMIRQPYSETAIPYKNHQIVDGYKLFMVDFDLGEDQIAYHDNVVANYHVSTGNYTAWNTGWDFRNDGVDIEVCEDEHSNGYAVGWTEVGEWLQYTVSVEAEGSYDLNIRASSAVDDNEMSLFVNNLPVKSSVSIPNTGSWEAWTTTVVQDIFLSQGQNILRIYIDKGEYNLNYIEFVGPGIPAAVQPELLKTTVQEGNRNYIIMAYNQPFKPVADHSDYSVVVNGNTFAIDSVYTQAGQDQIIVVELAEPLTYGDFAYISYSGTIVETENGVLLDAFADVPVDIDLLNPLDQNRIPGRVETENMTINSGFRTDVCLDVGGGLYTGWTDPDDYLIFDIDVLETGTYQIIYRHSGLGGSGQLNTYKLVGETEELLETVDFNSTLGWDNWSDKNGIEFDLEEGPVRLKLEVVIANFNLNYLQFNLIDVPAESDMRFIKGKTNASGDRIILDFNKPIEQNSVSGDGFKVLVDEDEIPFGSVVYESANSLALLLNTALEADNIIKVAYGEGGTITSTTQQDLLEFNYTLIKNNIEFLNLLPIPGRIEAEDFVVNSGFTFETSTDTGGGQNAGYTDTGDYLEFDVQVATTGKYKVLYRVASESAGGDLSLQKVVDNQVTQLDNISFSATGGWQNWITVEGEAELEAGNQKIRLTANASLFNINWVEFEKVPDNVLGLSEDLKEIKVYPNPSKDFFVFQFNEGIPKENILIYNISGRLVDFDISEYGDKRFLVRMLIKDSDNYYSHKLIIE